MAGGDVRSDVGSTARRGPSSGGRAHFQGRIRFAELVRASGSGCAGVPVMQPADLRDRNNPTLGRRLDFAAQRRVAIQGGVRPNTVVIGNVPAKNAPEVRFAQHDHVIQALSSKRADHAFGVRIRVRRRLQSIRTVQ